MALLLHSPLAKGTISHPLHPTCRHSMPPFPPRPLLAPLLMSGLSCCHAVRAVLKPLSSRRQHLMWQRGSSSSSSSRRGSGRQRQQHPSLSSSSTCHLALMAEQVGQAAQLHWGHCSRSTGQGAAEFILRLVVVLPTAGNPVAPGRGYCRTVGLACLGQHTASLSVCAHRLPCQGSACHLMRLIRTAAADASDAGGHLGAWGNSDSMCVLGSVTLPWAMAAVPGHSIWVANQTLRVAQGLGSSGSGQTLNAASLRASFVSVL